MERSKGGRVIKKILNKEENMVFAITPISYPDNFKKQDICELCPSLSDSSIEGALRKLVASGELKKEGKGKNTCYYRIK